MRNNLKTKKIMTKENEAFLGMCFKVKNFGIKNSVVLGTITGITALFATHNQLVTDLLNADMGSSADLTGYTIDKANKRKLLEQLCLKISNAATSFAVSSSNSVLQKRLDYATSFWYSCSEEKLVTEANILLNFTTPIAASLVGFGAVAADVPALGAAITNFVNVISDPSINIDIRKEDTKKIELVMDAIRTHFDTKLDIMMRSFEVPNPTIYALYRDARAIDINGSSQTPDADVMLAPDEVKTVLITDSYDPDTLFTVQNINDGSGDVSFTLSTINNEKGPMPVLLLAGETRQRLASNLAPDGIYLVVQNQGTTTAHIKAWVD